MTPRVFLAPPWFHATVARPRHTKVVWHAASSICRGIYSKDAATKFLTHTFLVVYFKFHSSIGTRQMSSVEPNLLQIGPCTPTPGQTPFQSSQINDHVALQLIHVHHTGTQQVGVPPKKGCSWSFRIFALLDVHIEQEQLLPLLKQFVARHLSTHLDLHHFFLAAQQLHHPHCHSI